MNHYFIVNEKNYHIIHNNRKLQKLSQEYKKKTNEIHVSKINYK